MAKKAMVSCLFIQIQHYVEHYCGLKIRTIILNALTGNKK